MIAVNTKKETIIHVNNQLLIETIHTRDWPQCCAVAYNDESYMSIPDKHGNMPIHLAVKFGCSNNFLNLILKVFPKCVAMKDVDGNLPLHLAMRHSRNHLWVNIGEITTTLININPRALRETDTHGNLPIHISLRTRGPNELLMFLLHVYPESAKIKENMGNFPLHLALGRTPVHNAGLFNSPFDIMSDLCKRAPEALKIKDIHGNLPVHLAFLNCGGTPGEEKLRIYMEGNPACLNVRNKRDCTPFMMMSRPQDHTPDDFK